MDNTDLRNHCYAMGYSDGEVGAFYDGYDKGKADAIEDVINKLKIEFHPCLNCISCSTDECNAEDYFRDCCVTEKIISFEDIINFIEKLKEQIS